MKQAPKETEVELLRIANGHTRSVELRVEPWGELLSMPPDASFEVVAQGPAGDHLEVLFGEGSITVYGWSGSVISIFQEGNLLRQCKMPVPANFRVIRRLGFV